MTAVAQSGCQVERVSLSPAAAGIGMEDDQGDVHHWVPGWVNPSQSYRGSGWREGGGVTNKPCLLKQAGRALHARRTSSVRLLTPSSHSRFVALHALYPSPIRLS